MAVHDRIRLTGLLRKKPWQRGFFYACRLAGDSSGWPRGGPAAVSRLSRCASGNGAGLWLELEYPNPTSLKDRMALAMIEGAERDR
jgi:hypothetical protein